MSASLRRFRALVYDYADDGTAGAISPTYTRSSSTSPDGAWWASKAMPSGRENTTGMKPEHRVDVVLSFSAAAPVTVDSAIVIDSVQYLVRAVLPRDHGRDELQVYAEQSADTLNLTP